MVYCDRFEDVKDILDPVNVNLNPELLHLMCRTIKFNLLLESLKLNI